MDLKIGNDWDELLSAETDKPYFGQLKSFVESEYAKYTVYPPRSLIFAALRYVPYSEVRVVIVGQDPYINPGQANGLAFAVNKGVKLPPSLVNIYKELSSDIGADMSGASGDLTGWAKQGVLLLNATLTVRAGPPDAQPGCGWQTFTDAVIKLLGKREKPLVFILWGSRAQKKREFIQPQHCVIASAHPSPLSAYNGFFGSRPFSRANAFLVGHGLPPVDWTEVSAYDKPLYYEGKGRIERG